MNQEELEQKYAEAQAALVEKSKSKLKDVADEVISNLYTDVTAWAAGDARANYHNFLRDEMRASFIKEITTQYGHYSWAHSIRTEMLKHHREELQNKIIEDLEAKVKEWQDRCYQMQERYR